MDNGKPTTSRQGKRYRYDMWSLGIIFFFFLLIVSALFSFSDPDFWWHFRTGEFIFKTGQVPSRDIFSFTAAGKPWMSHEWLAEWLIYLLVSRATYWGGLFFFGALFAGAFWLIDNLLREFNLHPAGRLLLLAWAAIIAMPFLTVRPRLFTIFFFTLFLTTIVRYYRGQRVHWWLLPVVMAFWVNVHAGYISGLALLGLLFVAEMLRGWRDSQVQHRLRTVGIVFTLTLLASLITPHGLKALWYPFTYLGHQNPSSAFVSEWQSPNFHHPNQWLLVAAILFSMATGLVWQKKSWLPLLLLGSVTAAVLHAVRYLPLFAITWATVEGEWLAGRWPATIGNASRTISRRQAWHNGLTFAVLLILTVGSLPYFASRGRLQSVTMPRTDDKGMTYPAEAVDWLQQNRPQARLFNQYRWGGYLIYRLWPGQKVFIDGRDDMYGSQLVLAYEKCVTAQPGWDKLLDQWHIDTVLLSSKTALSAVLDASPQWEKAFVAPKQVIFIRRLRRP